MSSFAFLPRTLGRQERRSHNAPNLLLSPDRPASETPGTSVAPSHKTSPKPVAGQSSRTELHDDHELLSILELSLSDYAIWCTPELQHQMKRVRDGYIPMKYISENSPFFPKDPIISDLALMQCLRTSTSTILEARMLIAEPSHHEWLNSSHGRYISSTKDSRTGYEVRRKDWESLLQNLQSDKWTREWWLQRTFYIERLPPTLRSIPAISRYIESLLTPLGGKVLSHSSRRRVQSVTLPSHYLASLNEISRCKGYAFVVLDSPELVAELSSDYPWEGIPSRSGLDKDAVKLGLRVLPHASWDILKAEYLSYQRRLLSEAAEEAAEWESSASQAQPQNILVGNAETIQPATTQNHLSWYPQDCLVFVRNIHPETNKTTLKNLFQSALSTSGGGVDYVDYVKGVDSCHLRLASPSLAMQLRSHFDSQSIAQNDPLDQIGSAPTEGRPRIKLEIVQGKREELYWEKVPQKLRVAALERLTGQSHEIVGTDQQGNKSKKRRKNA